MVRAVLHNLSTLLPAPECGELLALDWDGSVTEVLIGRSQICDVVLIDKTVSRLHVRLYNRDGFWLLEDLASTNGTYVNGRRIGRCRVVPGDQLTVGEKVLRVD